MNFLISLAFKNLTRYKRRTMITTGAIALGIILYIFVDSMLLGLEKKEKTGEGLHRGPIFSRKRRKS
jgi:hypothetical protein